MFGIILLEDLYMFKRLNLLAKKKNYYLLHTWFLGVLFTVSVLIVGSRSFNDENYNKFIAEYDKEIGCEVTGYELVCEDDYYMFDSVVIDLEQDAKGVIITEGILLTRDRIATNGLNMTYEEFFATIGHESENFSSTDGLAVFKSFVRPITFLIVLFLPLLVWVGHMLFNFIRTAMNKVLVSNLLKVEQDYWHNYKVTILAVTPLVVVNMITRSLWGGTIVNLITSYIPGIGGIISFLINSFIIFGVTYLMIKSEESDTSVELLDELIEEEKEML